MIKEYQNDSLPKNYSEMFENEMKYWHVPGFSAVIVKEGKPILLGAWGMRDVEKRLPFTVDTASGIGSCSKSMTSFIAGCLADEGKLDIDKPLKDYIPGFEMYDKCAQNDLCLRDMMSHRTGLGGHDGTWPDNSISRMEYVKRLKYMQPNKPFRSVAQYSNVMFAAVGGIEEYITGKSWEELAQSYIWDPLKMTHTYADMDPAEKCPDHATPYSVIQKKPHALKMWNIDQAGPCGSVMSSASDMAKWISLQIGCGEYHGHRLISKDMFFQLHKPVNIMDFPKINDYAVSMGYALGWRAVLYRGIPLQQHSGKIEGYSAYQFYLPDYKTGGAFLMNMHEPANEIFFALASTYLDYVLGMEPVDWSKIMHPEIEAPEEKYHSLEFNWMPASAPAPETSPSHNLKDYAGEFFNGGYGIAKIICKGGRLYFQLRDENICPMFHHHYDVFRVEGIKEDTNTITAPAYFETDPDTGTISLLKVRLEPMVDDIIFTRTNS